MPGCGSPWAAARARRSLGLRGTARGPQGGRAQPHGGAHPGPIPHGKAQSAAPMLRRMRFSVTSPLGGRGAQPPASLRGTMENGPTGQMRSSNPPPGCGALWEMAQLGKCARATARQPAGRVAPSSRNGDDHVCDRPRPSYASTHPLKSCGLVQTTAMRVQTPTREVPFSIAR